jgi:hypothetical protein
MVTVAWIIVCNSEVRDLIYCPGNRIAQQQYWQLITIIGLYEAKDREQQLCCCFISVCRHSFIICVVESVIIVIFSLPRLKPVCCIKSHTYLRHPDELAVNLYSEPVHWAVWTKHNPCDRLIKAQCSFSKQTSLKV